MPPSRKLPHKILAIDIGGNNIKGSVLDHNGKILQRYKKVATPKDPVPTAVLKCVQELATGFQNYDRISVGFPGYVRKGVVYTAPNLGTDAWKGVNVNVGIRESLHRPVRILNDADMHGLGVVAGKGLEMVITLGTGFGTSLFLNGNLLPHIELAHHAITKRKTYDDYLGDRALEKIGKKKWNKRLKKVLEMLQVVFNYDSLYIGGGNASRLNLKLDKNVKIVTNKDGIKGGARIWQLDENLFMKVVQDEK